VSVTLAPPQQEISTNRLAQARVPELDGLRGLAILVVWLGHYFYVPSVGIFRFLNDSWLGLGWSGVDLFFVLSGFLIGGILLGHRESNSYFKTFYARRFFRIIPVYYAWILAYVLLVTIGGSFLRAHAHTGNIEGFDWPIAFQFLFLQNFGDFLTSPISYFWFTATWSLAVEEQFYLVSPLLVRFLSKRLLAIFLGVVVLTSPLIRLLVRHFIPHGPWLAYRLMPCRADALAMGMIAAMLWRSDDFRRWLASHRGVMQGVFTVLLAGFAFLWRWHSDPLTLLTQTVGYTWLAIFYAALLLLVLSNSSWPIAAVARNGFLRNLGGLSYCIYIVHLAIFLLCHQLLSHGLPTVTNARTGAVSLLAAGISYCIAWVSWRVLEQPMLQRGHSFKY
jgi:peptidoglycan/LPS O-acetylase OafA/YrhL